MTTFLATVLVLGVLIFVHELGHFLVAKWAGIKVERFSLGFPPKMIGFTRGETEYCISWIPLGGYVKMAGENPDEEEVTGDPREFMSKGVGVRSLVILAGPVMNYVAAIVLFGMVFFFYGKPMLDTGRVVVGPVVEGSPAEKVGIKAGDIITAVDHKPVATFQEMAEYVHQRPGQTIEVVWTHGEELYSAPITTMFDTLKTAEGADSVVGRLGVGMGFDMQPTGFFGAIGNGFSQTFYVTGEMFKFLGGLFSGRVSLKLVSGPVGIAQMAGQVAREGLDMLLNFMAVLSVNLAIINVLPIPILDGGHLVFLLFEKLRGHPLSIRQRAIAQQVGLALLVLLIVTVTYHDILRLLGG